MPSAASRSVKRCESGPAGSPRSSYSIPDRPSAKTNHRTTVNPRLCHLREVGERSVVAASRRQRGNPRRSRRSPSRSRRSSRLSTTGSCSRAGTSATCHERAGLLTASAMGCVESRRAAAALRDGRERETLRGETLLSAGRIPLARADFEVVVPRANLDTAQAACRARFERDQVLMTKLFEQPVRRLTHE